MDKLVNAVFNDFIEHWMIVTQTNDRATAIYDINNGCCYQAALSVAAVLTENYNYHDIKFNNHCLHGWLTINGVDCDVLYPAGYPQPVVKEWLLDDINYNDKVMMNIPCSKHEFKNMMQLHLPHHVYLLATWYQRHGISSPDYLPEAIKYHNKLCNHTSRYRLRNAKRRAEKSLQRVFNPSASCPDLGVKPITHYYHGEFESDTSRPLLPAVVMSSVKMLKHLQYESRQYKTEVTRL